MFSCCGGFYGKADKKLSPVAEKKLDTIWVPDNLKSLQKRNSVISSIYGGKSSSVSVASSRANVTHTGFISQNNKINNGQNGSNNWTNNNKNNNNNYSNGHYKGRIGRSTSIFGGKSNNVKSNERSHGQRHDHRNNSFPVIIPYRDDDHFQRQQQQLKPLKCISYPTPPTPIHLRNNNKESQLHREQSPLHPKTASDGSPSIISEPDDDVGDMSKKNYHKKSRFFPRRNKLDRCVFNENFFNSHQCMADSSEDVENPSGLFWVR